jgi:hypothetical protein
MGHWQELHKTPLSLRQSAVTCYHLKSAFCDCVTNVEVHIIQYFEHLYTA